MTLPDPEPLMLLRNMLKGMSRLPLSDDADLYQMGIVDSFALLDLILAVENESGRTFQAELLDLEGGISIGKIAGAFVA